MIRMQGLSVVSLVLCAATGCADPSAVEAEQKPEVPAELKSYVLNEAPTDIPHRLHIDFGGKAEIIGYALEPERLAAPGSKIQLKLFWHSSNKISPGFTLFTQLTAPSGKRFPAEGAGPLRKGPLSPSEWEPGNVYIDELELSVPEELDAARFSIVTGIRGEPSKVVDAQPEGTGEQEPAPKPEAEAEKGTFSAVHLRVLSGASDGRHGGVIATLDTGITPGSRRAKPAKDAKRAGQAAGQRRPGPPSGLPLGVLPANGTRPPSPPRPAQ